MKLIDVHIHVFPDDVADAYIENYGSHSNLKAVCRPTLDSVFEEYRNIDVLKFVILQEWQSTIPFKSRNLKLMAKPDDYYFYSYNAWLAELQRKHKNVVCFGGVHPEEDDRLEEFERMAGVYELSGLKLPQCMQQFHVNDKRMFPVYERAQACNIPVLFHTGLDPIPGMDIYGHPKDVDDVAREFAGLKIIMAHLGTPFIDEAQDVMKRRQNVFADISFFIEIEGSDSASCIIRKIGAEKLMFGSDFPFIKPRSAIETLLCTNLSDEDKERILWKTAHEVLNL
ncbi:amidohydrolase [Candidatus Poribacteria bacterium]|nr:amidohydrolase [Candidatus Poribacteria bacterium]